MIFHECWNVEIGGGEGGDSSPVHSSCASWTVPKVGIEKNTKTLQPPVTLKLYVVIIKLDQS